MKESLTEVCQNELRRRDEITSRLYLPGATYDLTDPKDDETLCAICRSWTGLSALQFNCTKKVLCLECAVDAKICSCESPCYYLRVRYSDRHLRSLAQRVKDLMQLRKNRYKALIKHVNKMNTLALEQLAPIVEINRSYRFGLPLDDIESIVDDAANWENNLTLIAYETARNIWPRDYQNVSLIEFDLLDFLYEWDDRLKDILTHLKFSHISKVA